VRVGICVFVGVSVVVLVGISVLVGSGVDDDARVEVDTAVCVMVFIGTFVSNSIAVLVAEGCSSACPAVPVHSKGKTPQASIKSTVINKTLFFFLFMDHLATLYSFLRIS
jgi:hypothetical protein